MFKMFKMISKLKVFKLLKTLNVFKKTPHDATKFSHLHLSRHASTAHQTANSELLTGHTLLNRLLLRHSHATQLTVLLFSTGASSTVQIISM